jgi:hypothetical protein
VKLSGLTLVVLGHRALLVGHAGSRREQARHIADCILAAGNLAVPGRNSPGCAAAVVGSFVAGSRSDRSPVAEERIGLEADIAGSPGCIDHKVRTWWLCV